MTSLADKAILSGADNRQPMLEKDMYDSWKSRMELYMLNRQHGRMILESVEQGPLLWPTVEEDGVTRLKKYSELSAAEAIQDDCDVKATNIILQGLPPEVYALVSTHKVAKELLERIQMLLQGTFSLLLNDMNMYNMKLEQFQVNMKFLNTLHPEWKYSPPKTRLEVLVFQKGDDPIDAINHMMSFLTAVVTSRYPATNNQLRTSSNPRQQATINNGRVTIQPIQGRQNFVLAGSSRLFTSGSGGAPGKQRQEEKKIEEEQAANARYWKIPACSDDDDAYNSAITPNEPIDSLSMGDEHLNTIPTTESDEFIKSSVENLVPNPSESEGENGCDVHACFTTFSNVLFDANYEFDSSDDHSLYDEDVPEKIFSNPLFEEEIIPLKIDPHHFNVESDLIESMLNRDSSIISSSSKINSLLDEFTGELILFKSISSGIDKHDCYPENDIHLVERLLYDNSSPRPSEEFVSKNSNAKIESFSPSPIRIEDTQVWGELGQAQRPNKRFVGGTPCLPVV
nr:hypothetical protein [Tanacetum cinerariifolium]